jgi:hypothetical protein
LLIFEANLIRTNGMLWRVPRSISKKGNWPWKRRLAKDWLITQWEAVTKEPVISDPARTEAEAEGLAICEAWMEERL